MDEAKIEELSEKMDPGYFNRKLQDEVNLFINKLNENKKYLKKGELVMLLKHIVRYPDIQSQQVSEKVMELAELGTNAKDSFVALTVQVLVEEGQRRKEELTQPKFKGEEDGE